MNTIYLVRHGETMWNHSGKYQGQTDVPLNERGILQAQRCADALKDIPINRIIASDLSRAKITAETILKSYPKEIPIRYDKRLREINFGDWESLTYDEIQSRWPGAIEAMYRQPSKLKIKNGESFQMVQDRAWAAIADEIKLADDGETILVVCHGGTIRTIICKVLNMSLDYSWNFSQGNTAISCLEFAGMGPDDHNVLSLLNNLDHLKGI